VQLAVTSNRDATGVLGGNSEIVAKAATYLDPKGKGDNSMSLQRPNAIST